ncbi:type III secretion inner membrane ring lipoprotein SctJ [Hahella sp. CR1]|uniref:type III secretion system inner membrane ring lipoprotein SctJ n=1 Tax=Hahella sp. CR1 TaxID=2992807 RepID=UPI00244146F0|nr:type III secretion inner membrane ring lipoprotein SctJ [Hahella sp. CR1]MDG9668385.1 type III secretion inner membrane ring lipoprotein SctJ [Hahella sp. CR1]
MKKRQIWRSGLCLLLLLLGGCKTELYSGLSQQEGNEMYAILRSTGFNVEMEVLGAGKDQNVRLKLPEQQVARAISVLQRQGYPKQHFATMGDIFAKDGLISSPTEEKARFIYAISQELSHTLSNIDGVLVARVHVVMQEGDKFDKNPKPSTASVFIKYVEDAPIETLTPKIKALVSNSILGLEYDQVSVALFPSSLKRITSPEEVSNGGMMYLWAGIGALLVLLLVGALYYAVRAGWIPRKIQTPAIQKLA